MKPLLSVEKINVIFPLGYGKKLHAIKDVSLTLNSGETLGLVGESGSGKSTIGRVILGLLPAISGKIIFDGEDITAAKRDRRRQLGRDIQVIFQDPYGSLNPARKIGDTLSEPLHALKLSKTEINEKIHEVLKRVGMPIDTAERYPNQFSGGQRQRIAIARAVIAKPRLVICDEPVSALDLSVQAQVLNLLNELQQSMGLALLFISHDLAVVRHVSHRTIVLYQGEIVEEGLAETIHNHPQHPYTKRLLAAAPLPDPVKQKARRALANLHI